MVLMYQKEWYELTTIPIPDDVKSLLGKCMKLIRNLEIMRICLKRGQTFPNDYMINLRTQMWGIITDYLSFLKQFSSFEDMKKIEDELKQFRADQVRTEEEVKKEIGNMDRHFFEMQRYLNLYSEFIYSYIFETIKEAEREYVKGLRKEIAFIMLRKVGILIPPPPIEEKKPIGLEAKIK